MKGKGVFEFMQSFIYTDLETLVIETMEPSTGAESLGEKATEFLEWKDFQVSKLLIASDLSKITWKLRSGDIVRAGDSALCQVPLADWLEDLTHSNSRQGGVLSRLKRIDVDVVPDIDLRHPLVGETGREDCTFSRRRELCDLMKDAACRFSSAQSINFTWPTLLAADGERGKG